tara:strand:+ start:248 stop:442 length:195 start_codon:yes stop_codon:yes gene_type:complete
MIRVSVIVLSLLLSGCPVEDEVCQKIMICEEDKEMLCYEMDNGCIDECHYWVFESCFEVCKNES